MYNLKQYPNKPIWNQITEFAVHCIEDKNETEQTMHGKMWILENFVKTVSIKSLEELTEVHINRWLDEMIERGCKGRTANNRWIALRPMIHYHRDMGLIIPAKLCKVKKHFEVKARQVFYTAEQIDKVLSYCSPMQWLLIKLAFDSGLRLSELTNLRLQEIDGRQLNYIGKGRRQRESYMSPETRQKLDDYIMKNNITDYLWKNPNGKDGKPLSTTTIRNQIKRPFHYAGFTDAYPHALRHSFCTDGQRRGADFEKLRDMLGHKNIETTQRYAHGLEGHLRKIFDQYKFGIEPKDEASLQPKNLDEGAINFMRKLAEEFAAVTR